ncbi:MAG: T9SS type A sorting domain-containing protein [Bacteroidota bacterium]
MKINTTRLRLAVYILLYTFWITRLNYPIQKNFETITEIQEKLYSKPSKKSIIIGETRYDGPEKYAYFHQAIRTGRVDPENVDMSSFYTSGYQKSAIQKAVDARNKSNINRRTKNLEFIERGPVNVPGRTRGLIVDPGDPSNNTWFAGSVSGGIWKTVNAGERWVKLTADLPNLAFTTLAMPTSNPNVIYAGTGEGSYGGLGSVNGNGIFKSTDGGNTWQQLASTNNDNFSNVSRVIVNPEDADELLACTTTYSFRNGSTRNSYIFKSEDGGLSWETVYTSPTGNDVQHLVATPDNFSVIYAAVNGLGIFKTTDAGRTWEKSSAGLVTNDLKSPTGILNDASFGRLEIAIAPNNTDIIYTSVEGTASGTNSDLYVSFNAGASWSLVVEQGNDPNPDWLQNQGWYDNTITVHPFNDSIVYVGGINTWKSTLQVPIDTAKSTTVVNFDFDNLASFAEVTNIFADEGQEVTSEDYVDIEVRFGPGLRQKAHRFTVPRGSASGVPAESYSYRNYVDVPFEVWDVTNNRQLMASFRDNLSDGTFSLTNNSNTSREYIYVHTLPYDETPNAEIATNAGHVFKSLYLIWLYSAEGINWNPNNLPNATISLAVETQQLSQFSRSSINIADVYNQNSGLNRNVHPDQHNLIILKEGGETFRILNANDGGIYVTDPENDPGVAQGTWNEAGITYNTSQFYGADKKPGANEYIGGTQDNGTWISINSSEDAEAIYRRVIGGDGFEVIWHYKDPNKIIGGSQFNGFARSTNGGRNFQPAVEGLEDDGPFITRLGNSKSDPDVLFAVGGSGVYKSDNFGESWNSIPITTRWGFWSGTDIEVSLANPQIVWAGGGMTNVRSIHVSTNGGNTFTPTNNYPQEIGVATGIYSHPFQDSTVYALFSINNRPKILKTEDLGNSWQDISGFAPESTSTGFPNVAVYSLLVMPYDTNIIWVGTEIGIIESQDNGQSWQLIDSNFPAVSVWDMKVVDDQVVIATHGRGIWTITIPELADFGPTEATLSPILFSASQAVGINGINLDIDFRSEYDSVQIIANEEVLFRLEEEIQLGRGLLSLRPFASGQYTLQVIGFKDGNSFVSSTFDINVAEFIAPTNSYASNFNDANDDFDLNRFAIGQDADFDDPTLHSPHPYPTADSEGMVEIDLTATLKIPIIVAEQNALISYKDIAIVEPGEVGTVFGDSEFWDFVIVEGSKDGLNWEALANGYDADFNTQWKTAFENESNGEEALFIEQEIDLLQTFNPGDTVLVRFRLFSNPFSSGWGWAIDDLRIQTAEITRTNTSKIAQLVTVFPNPSNGLVAVSLENVLKGKVEIKVFNQIGKEIIRQEVDNSSGFSSQQINLQNQPKGLYIIQLSNGVDKVTKKLITE